MSSQILKLYEWDSGVTLAPLVIPVRLNESPEQAAFRYLNELSKNACLMKLFENRIPQLPMKGFTPLEQTPWESRVLMMANLPYDYSMYSPRVQSFTRVFNSAGQRSFLLPINADLGLTCEETKELFSMIAHEFPFMVAMGGDDVDPSLYRQTNSHCGKITPSRDRFEASLISSYVAQEKGFLLGVCRGSQITSVALGYELIQDLPHHLAHHKGTPVAHGNDWHTIEVRATTHKILNGLASSSDNKLLVNSIHHQSVVYREGGPLEIAAQAPDGVTEATEFSNGRGLLLQFHPELMKNDLGDEILLTALRHKKLVFG